jgi:molybdate transport system regulatory protein
MPTATRKLKLTAQVKTWLEVEGEYVCGIALVRMLEAVERTGSIKRAAQELGKSYRYIWGRIKEAEDALGESLVETHVGGKGVQRSALTPVARRLAAAFTTYREQVLQLAEAEFRRHFDSLQ